MFPAPKLRRSLVFLMGILLPFVLQGQDFIPYPLSAWIKLPTRADAFRVEIHSGIQEGSAAMNLSGQTQQRQVQISLIEKIQFLHPPWVADTLATLEQEEATPQAMSILKGYCTAVLPYVIIPENNAAPVLDRFLTSLHPRRDVEVLREVYGKLSLVENASTSALANAWLAYLDAREGTLEPAADSFGRLPLQEDSGEVFYLQQLAFCRNQMARNEYRQAIDHSSRVIAVGSIEDPLYPEALYLSAQCYDRLAEKEQARLAEVRKKTVEKELLRERVQVARELEAQADHSGTPPPTEQEILAAVDQQAVEDRVPPVPSMRKNHFALIAQRLYLFTEQIFPSTYWGKEAGTRVWEETREQNRKDLSNFVPTDSST